MDEVFNKYQSSLKELHLESYPDEIKEQFYDFLTNVTYIKNLISPNRPYAKDCPRDESGKIIVDLTNPPIITDTDYFRPTAIHFQKYGCITKLRPNANPNSEYGKWVREEIRRCFEGYVRESDGAWVTGDMYFFLNYCPIMKVKVIKGNKGIRVSDFPDFQEGQWIKYMYIQQARDHAKHGFELASRGKGKAHPYSERVFTPNGWKQWGDIKPEDSLYAPDGKITKVICIPFDKEESIYRVTLADGRSCRCTGGHLFNVFNTSTNKVETINVNQMKGKFLYVQNKGLNSIDTNEVDDYLNIQKGQNPYMYEVPLNKAIEYPYIKVTVNPIEYAKLIVNKINKGEEVIINEDYLYNSIKIRSIFFSSLLSLLGTHSNPIMIRTKSRVLKDALLFLGRSLGFYCVDYNRANHIKSDTFRLYFFVRIEYIQTKYGCMSKLVSSVSLDYVAITNIQYVGEEKAKCVMVDHPSDCYLINDFIVTHNSFTMAAIAAKRFILGDYDENEKKIVGKVETFIASYIKEYLNSDGILNKFESYIDFCHDYTEFPRKRLISSITAMHWQMGYKENGSEAKKGSLNEVVGIPVKDNAGKLRGKRGAFIGLEEGGSFPNLIELYGTLRPSMEDGDIVFGMIYLQGTSGDKLSDFSAAQQIMYSPRAFNMYPIPNVYDKKGQGKQEFVLFFPAYLNRNGCQDKDGISDVTKAILEILINRYNVKYNSSNANLIIRTIAEHPIVPQEAVLKVQGSIFPTQQLNERLQELETNTNLLDDVYIGVLVQEANGQVTFKPTADIPIRVWPTADNKVHGALEIYEMPEKDSQGKVFPDRYIIGHDPVDSDHAESMSLSSTFVFDLFTDRIVAEYTGRQEYADDNYEIVRKLCIFFNAKCMYENNLKGIFAYFSKMNCVQYLANTPQYLKDQQIIREIGRGNQSKGIHATAAINAFADNLIKDWLLKPVVVPAAEGGQEVTMFNLMFIRCVALLMELAAYNPEANFDRIRALGMVMLYRQEKIILYQGDMSKTRREEKDINYLGNDSFFTDNFDCR